MTEKAAEKTDERTEKEAEKTEETREKTAEKTEETKVRHFSRKQRIAEKAMILKMILSPFKCYEVIFYLIFTLSTVLSQ